MPHVFEFIHFRDRRDLPHLAVVTLLISGIALGVYLSLRPQIFTNRAFEGGLVEVAFAPQSLEIQRGKTYETKINVNPKEERVTAMQLELGYDPASVTILEVKNEGFLPINLKTQDSFDGRLTLVYGGTVQTQATTPGTAATIKFKVTENKPSEISVKPTSQVSVSSKEGNVLTSFSKLTLSPAATAPPTQGSGEISYPESLLLEDPVFPEASPFVEDFKEALEPKPSFKPERLEPELSEAYLKQLGKDIFIEPIVALNQVLEEKASEIIN